ncbi:MAG: hypothetical protein U5K37_02830 [Natrialbaceae archaeon]|nr:hypothetical protein [Natrialbaceae archaeon]
MDRDAPVITRQTIKGLGITENVDEVFEQFSESTPEEIMALANLEDERPADLPNLDRMLPARHQGHRGSRGSTRRRCRRDLRGDIRRGRPRDTLSRHHAQSTVIVNLRSMITFAIRCTTS